MGPETVALSNICPHFSRPGAEPRTVVFYGFSIPAQLMPTHSVIILYYQNRFALLSPLQYTQLLLTLSPEVSKKILSKARRLQRELDHELKLVRPP